MSGAVVSIHLKLILRAGDLYYHQDSGFQDQEEAWVFEDQIICRKTKQAENNKKRKLKYNKK
jgi:hypothetical protein